MQARDVDRYVKDSTWATLPAVFLGLSAMYLLVFQQHSVSYFLLACGIFGAWLCDFTTLSMDLLPDLTAVASGILILSLSDLAADLSDSGMVRFTLVLGGALVVPYALLRWVFRRPPVQFRGAVGAGTGRSGAIWRWWSWPAT